MRELPTPIWVRSKDHAELFLTVGMLARFFHTPIDFFLDMDISEVHFWADVMNEIIKRENAANERAMKRGR